MSIDEAIERCETLATKGHIIFSRDPDIAEECNEKYEQLAEWLEELKDYRDKNKMVVRIDCVNSEEFKDIAVKLAKEQYNKAIDDYKSGIKEELERFEVKNLDTCVLYDLMDRKAERLKAGGNIELSEHSKSKGNRTGK